MVENIGNLGDGEKQTTDTVSDVGSNSSIESCNSSQSSKSSIMTVKAEAKRAALLVHAAAMERKHTMEMEVELLQKKMEKIQIEIEIEASDAELAVSRAFSEQDGMESYFERTEEWTGLPGVRQASIVPVKVEYLPAVKRENSDAQPTGTITPVQHETVPVTRRQRAGTVGTQSMGLFSDSAKTKWVCNS